jgi:hypothetical protein
MTGTEVVASLFLFKRIAVKESGNNKNGEEQGRCSWELAKIKKPA